uniref:Uncharacterized protein n=1 Tax=Hemiselmis tepida TaxID=464990 RepID=A0A7S0VLX9_9CRYP|mmetsp:Transcript_21321/g.53748  ORF Transcript_21321/g.53748 Transcript_21321/m.53748 type:complete len:516 (+) Transcript_21321:246-1793(+)
MPALVKKQANTLTDAQVKAALAVREGVANDSNQADVVVQALVEALPDRRPLECNRLRAIINEPGGKVTVWDQLGRRREEGGATAGLTALIEMLGANNDQFQALGQEPSSGLLASLCTQNDRVQQLCRQKFLLKRLMSIMGDERCNEATRRNTSWVLRRCCEVSAKIRMELGSDRTMLQLLGRIMRNEPLQDTKYKPGGDASEIGSRPASRSGSSRGGRTRPPSRTTSGLDGGSFNSNFNDQSGHFDLFRMDENTNPDGNMHWGNKTPGTATPNSTGLGLPPAQKGSTLGLRPQSAVSASHFAGSVRSVSAVQRGGRSPGVSRPATAESAAGGGAYFRGSSRPPTGMGTTAVRDADSMCVQGNACCTIGNCCYSDEAVERLAKTDGVITGLLYVIEYGTEWASGHAARALGNLCYSPANTRLLTEIDTSNVAARNLVEMVMSANSSRRTKELALFALANLTRAQAVCSRLIGLPGIYGALGELASQGVAREDVDRTICNMSQARLGTRTWRQPKKL